MIKMKGITKMDDGFKKIKFKYNNRTYSTTVPAQDSVFDAINNYIKGIENASIHTASNGE